jgi:hypothetical protein
MISANQPVHCSTVNNIVISSISWEDCLNSDDISCLGWSLILETVDFQINRSTRTVMYFMHSARRVHYTIKYVNSNNRGIICIHKILWYKFQKKQHIDSLFMWLKEHRIRYSFSWNIYLHLIVESLKFWTSVFLIPRQNAHFILYIRFSLVGHKFGDFGLPRYTINFSG